MILFIIREVNSDMPIYILNRTNAGKNQMPRAGFEPTTPRSHDLGPGITSVGRRDMLIGPDVIDHTNVYHGIFRTNCSSSERSTLIAYLYIKPFAPSPRGLGANVSFVANI